MKTLFILLLTLNCSFLFAQPGKVDTTFNTALYSTYGTGNGFPSNNFIQEVCEQPDGKLIVAGGFSEHNGVPRYGVARVNTDGSLDYTFDANSAFQNTNLNYAFTSLLLQDDGKIITIKSYSNGGGTTNSSIRRFNPDGSPDPLPVVLGQMDQGVVQKAVLQPDGKLILCGEFIYQDENQDGYINLVRINTDGSVDQTFTGGLQFDFMPYGKINDLKLDSQGRILIGGAFNGYNGIPSKGIIRLNTDGTVDGTLNLGTGLSDLVKTIAIQPDQKIILGGDFISYQSTYANRIVRINPNGSIDGTFQLPGAYSIVEQLNVMPDSSIVFLGSNTSPAVPYSFVKLNADGTLNMATPVGVIGYSNWFDQFKVLSSGKFVVIGQFDEFRGKDRGEIARLNSDFSLDGSFGPKPGFNGEIQRTLVQPDGKIYVGKALYTESEVNVYNDTFVKGLVRLEADGTLDTTFHIADSLFVSVEIMARQADGKIVVGGMTKVFDGNSITNRNVVRFNSDGTLDPSFIPYVFTSWELHELLIQPDGKIILLGRLSVNNGSSFSNITRLNSDGTPDPTFIVGSGTDNVITAGTITNSGKIIIGGDFTSYNGVPFQRFVAINPDGSIDPTFAFNGHVNSEVKSIKKQSDGKIYLTAQSLSTNNNIAVSILRLNIDGSVDNSFAEVFNSGDIKTLLPLPDGKLLVGGDIFSLMGISAYGIARLNPNGSRDTTFYSAYVTYAPNVIVQSISLGLDGKVIIGGDFSKVAGIPSNNLAVLHNDLDAYFDVSFMNVSNINCSGNGTATAFASGGTPPYQYIWNTTGNITDSLQSISVPGVYTCQVQDATGIISSASLLIDGPAASNGFDLKANLSAGSFRTGFENTIVLTALNDGCIATSGQLIYVMDTVVHFNSAIPAPTYQSNDTLIWDFSNLSYDSGYLMPVINCTVSTAAQIGDTVWINLWMTPVIGDADTLNNARNYTFPVINGYDPNIKSVYPVGKCDEAYIENGQKLTYTVQFQNTGNANAINIVVVDSLDQDLNLNSLHIVGNSHDVWVEVVQNNTVKFHFDLINLPDSSTNEAASHGYVVFEIDPISDSLFHNTVISNKAEIYFDFNPPIITNSCINTIYDGDLDSLDCNPVNLIVEELGNQRNINVYPNPTSNRITISTNETDKEMIQISITDLSGKVVCKSMKDQNIDLELDLTSLETGTYILIIRGVSGELVNSSRIVKI
jgi:uncharacterized delta-60 repeat protein/uncharacterized repeat protein (TIGR01451 family)